MQFGTIHLGGADYVVSGRAAEVDRKLRSLLARLTVFNIEFLRAHPKTPWLYEAGVRYEREPKGQELWQAIPQLFRSRLGDCEDLACARAAELRVRCGEKAKAIPRGRDMGDHFLYHIVVRRADGTIEDPSRKLGMR